MLRTNIAFDFATSRSKTVDGYLLVSDCRISRACVSPYLGQEIPGELGLDPDKIYNVLRDPRALREAVKTFDGIPLLREHAPVSAAAVPQDLIIGSVSNPRWQSPYIVADLTCWNSDSIARIEDGSCRELSCGYRFTAVRDPGEYDGERYEFRMQGIVGNHLATVPLGRVGPSCQVADAALDCEIELEPDDTEITFDVAPRRRRPVVVDTVVEIDMAARIRGYTRLP
jgi:hypothetical protein